MNLIFRASPLRGFRAKALNHTVIHTLRFPVLRTAGVFGGDSAEEPIFMEFN